MRVGLICPYSLSVNGGVQAQVLGLARTLRVQGVEARVLAPCDGPPPETWVSPLGHSIPTAANGSMAPLAPDPAAALRTIKALRDEAFDVIHIHEPLVPGASLTSLLFAHQPMVGTFHRSGAIGGGFATVRSLSTWAVDHLAVRCAVSADAAATAQAEVGGSYERVWNGIEVDLYEKTAPWPRPDGKVIFFVGRHEQRKGLGVLIEAIKDLDDDVRLWVAGHGPQTAALKAATAGDPRIEWLGSVGESEKRARMLAADVFCAPSLAGESFGIVLLEAMAGRTVVVASDLPGYRNVARDGKEAALAPIGDPKGLAAVIRKVLSDGAMRHALISGGLERAAHFSMSRLASTYVEYYKRAADTPLPKAVLQAEATAGRRLLTAPSRALRGRQRVSW